MPETDLVLLDGWPPSLASYIVEVPSAGQGPGFDLEIRDDEGTHIFRLVVRTGDSGATPQSAERSAASRAP